MRRAVRDPGREDELGVECAAYELRVGVHWVRRLMRLDFGKRAPVALCQWRCGAGYEMS